MPTPTPNNDEQKSQNAEVDVLASISNQYENGLRGLLTPGQVADLIGCSEAALRKWRLQKKIKSEATTPGGQHRYHPDEVRRFIRSLKQG